LLVAAAWVTGCALTAGGPSVRPEDVALTAKVVPSDVAACAPDVTWIVEVELVHLQPGPLHAGERKYMSEVNVFDGLGPVQPYDTGVGCNMGEADQQISFGNDGRTYTQAVRAAIQSGDLPPDYDELTSSASGFTYGGTDFPVKVRFYLMDSRLPEKIAVVYAHYEKGFAKDLSWTKIIYANQPAVAVAGGAEPPGMPPGGAVPLPACTASDGWQTVQSPMRPAAFDPTDDDAVLVHGTDRRIWQYPLGGGEPKPITSQPYGDFSPSPDGRWIAARQADSTEIWLIDRTSGEERSRTGLHGFMVGDWRPGGESFFFVSTDGDVGEYAPETGTTHWWAKVAEIPRDYRSERTVIEIPALPFHPTSAGRLSPDGTQLLFAGGGTHIATIFRLDLESGRLNAYPGTETDGFAPFWHPDGDRALFGLPSNRVLEIQLGRVTEFDDHVNEIVDLDADGRMLAVTGEDCWAVGPMPEAVPAALVPIYHAVPRHPAAAEHECIAVERCSFMVTGAGAEQVLDWYEAELEGLGWRSIHSRVPDRLARRFARGEAYLSISAFPWENRTGVRLHRRQTPEVTMTEAIAIAGAIHRNVAEKEWVAEYVAEFDSGRYGDGVRHPVWTLEARFPRSSVTVWVDALTAEPFRIRQSSDY
jgi:hypothetical protein